MNIDIGANLKRLRKSRDITQEELAEFLGVSFQSISKWERGDCYPDITMLPSLANFFSVSIDELMGVDRIQNHAYLYDTFRRVHEYEANNQHREAAGVLKQAIKTFPNNYGLLSELALALSFEDTSTLEGTSAIQEAIALSERVLADSTNEKVRSTTRSNLCFLYKRVGEHQRAMDLARTLTHIWESRELLLPELLDGQEYIDALRKSAAVILSVLYEKIDTVSDPDRSLAEVEKMIAIGPKEAAAASTNHSLMVSKISSFMG